MCLAWPPCPGPVPGLGVQAAPYPRARVLQAPAVPPCPAAPGTPKPPSRATRAFVPFWGQKGAFRTKEGAEAAVGVAVPSRPVQRQNKPKACPCPCPSRVRARVHVHAHTAPTAAVAVGKAPERPPSPSRAGSPCARTPAPSRLSPGVPPGAPLAAGIGAMAFQLEERWRWQRVLGATSCRLSVLPVSPWWLRAGPGPPGCPIPDGWVAPRRWHHPHSPSGCSRVPRVTGDARQESPASGARSGRGEAAWMGSVGAVTCHRPPGYPETCRSTRLKQASMRGRRAGGEGQPVHREEAPRRGLEGTRSTGWGRGCELGDPLWGREGTYPASAATQK